MRHGSSTQALHLKINVDAIGSSTYTSFNNALQNDLRKYLKYLIV